MSKYDFSALIDLLDDEKDYTPDPDIKDVRVTPAMLSEAFARYGVNVKEYKPSAMRSAIFILERPSDYLIIKKNVNKIKENLGIRSMSISVSKSLRDGAARIKVDIPREDRSPLKLKALLNRYGLFRSGDLSIPLGRSSLALVPPLELQTNLLIAGKSKENRDNIINSILMSVICNVSPNDVRFVLIGSGDGLLRLYGGIPHLGTSVARDMRSSMKSLLQIDKEIRKREELFWRTESRSITQYNGKCVYYDKPRLPSVLVVIEELAAFSQDEEAMEIIRRIALKGRLLGIHLILATTEPAESVFDPLLKQLILCRIAFAVDSASESRAILGVDGAEQLFDNCDMIYSTPRRTLRFQCATVSPEEIKRVCDHLRDRYGILKPDISGMRDIEAEPVDRMSLRRERGRERDAIIASSGPRKTGRSREDGSEVTKRRR